MTDRWQQAWDDAEPRLKAWKDSLSSLCIRPRVLRVGQLDAELLDEELVQTLREPLAKAFGVINAAFRSKLDPELALIIRLTLYKFSMWDLGATYGAKLQNLRYYCKNTSMKSLAQCLASGLPKETLVLHALLTILVPYFHTRIRSHALSNAWPDTPSSDKRRKAWNLMSNLESMHSASALLSFITFLWNGRYRTLADRLLSLRLVPSRRFTNRQVSYEFMNRQMVWHAFTEFLLLVLPVFSSRAFRRTYNQVNSRVRNFNWSLILPPSSPTTAQDSPLKSVQRGKFFGLTEDQCAICAENASFGLAGSGASTDSSPFSTYLDTASTFATGSSAQDNSAESGADGPPTHPITTPYRASCGHIYCYICLSERLLRAVDDGDDGWTCLRCAEAVHSCERVHAICEDDSARTSDGWASEVDDLVSFESDMDMSLDSEPDHF